MNVTASFARKRPNYRLGLLCSLLAVYPVVASLVLFYRFPFPFAGYLSGAEYVLPSLLAVLFYGIVCGGFLVLGLLSAVASWLIWICNIRGRSELVFHIVSGICVAFLCAGTLAILDKIIGPW